MPESVFSTRSEPDLINQLGFHQVVENRINLQHRGWLSSPPQQQILGVCVLGKLRPHAVPGSLPVENIDTGNRAQ